jgi:hypothetical protein
MKKRVSDTRQDGPSPYLAKQGEVVRGRLVLAATVLVLLAVKDFLFGRQWMSAAAKEHSVTPDCDCEISGA